MRARKRVILTGGLANVESNWFFLAKDGSNTYFYETITDNAIIQRSQFTPTIADRSALGYDTRNRTVFIINGSRHVLAYDPVHGTAKPDENIILATSNSHPSGVLWTEFSWSNPVVGVLDTDPAGSPGIWWYGEVGSTFLDTSLVLATSHKQLKRLRSFAPTLQIGETSFRAKISTMLERVPAPDPNQTPSVIELTRVRITPEYVLAGVRIGMQIQWNAFVTRPGETAVSYTHLTLPTKRIV